MDVQSLAGKTQAELLTIIAQMQAQPARKLSLKVTVEKMNEKTGKMQGTNGAISLYGMGRFPVTMYRTQWERLLDHADEIRAFIEANKSILAVKGD